METIWLRRTGAHATVIALAIAALGSSGCATPDVSGEWRGTWRVDWGLGSGDISLTLDQVEDEVTGRYDLDGSLCVEQGDVEGVVDGDSIRITLIADGGGRVRIEGHVSPGGDHIDGDFEVSEGWCGVGVEGDVDLRKQ